MKLSEAGETRVRGYLFVLHRSLASFMPREMAQDSVREVESHIRARVSQVEAGSDERSALEKVLTHLGPPLKVAQAYAAEITFDEAVVTGRPLPIFRALWHISRTVGGFFTSLGLFAGYAAGFAFVALALLKPVFPQNVGLLFRDGLPVGVGAIFPLGQGVEVVGGLALIPGFLLVGALILALTHRFARSFVEWWRRGLKGPMEE